MLDLMIDYRLPNENYSLPVMVPQHYEEQYNKNHTLIEKLDRSGNTYDNIEMTIDNQIALEINDLGYTIENITKREFNDFDKRFDIYTVELKNEIEDYNLFVQNEKIISKKLNLYTKNIMLEIV